MDVSLNEQRKKLNDVMKNLPGLSVTRLPAGLFACDHEELMVVLPLS